VFAILWSASPDRWTAKEWSIVPAAAVDVSDTNDGLMLQAHGFAGHEVDVVARGVASDDAVTWRVQVDNRSSGTVAGLYGPALRGVTALDGAQLFIPDRVGQRVPDPWSVFAQAPYPDEYPLGMSMQFLAYANQERGIALHVHDRDLAYKEFLMGGPGRELSVILYPFIEPGAHWESPPLVWQLLDSDWHAAADRYREWFMSWAGSPEFTRWFRSFPLHGGAVILGRPADNETTPDNFKIHEVGTYDAAIPKAEEAAAEGLDGFGLCGWYGTGHDTSFPEFTPTEIMGGEGGFERLTSRVRELGLALSVYTNLRLGNQRSPLIIAHPDWRVEPTKQTPYGVAIDDMHYGDQDFWVMCPASPGYHDHVIGTVRELVGRWGVRSMQLDQVAAPPSMLCFNRAHDHRLPSTAWGEGYPRLLRAVRDTGRAIDPEFSMWIQGAWDGAGMVADLSQGGVWPVANEAVALPEVYHYTLPQHPLMGGPLLGGVPWDAPQDVEAARRVYGQVGDVFLDGRFMDTVGLRATSNVSARWWRAMDRAVITMQGDGAATETAVSLDIDLLPRSELPTATWSSDDKRAARVRIQGDAAVVEAPLTPGAVTVVELRWGHEQH
jgi:hypothetical protein